MLDEYHWLPFKATRVLRLDGDGLAYYCAGGENTAPEQTAINLEQRIRHAKYMAGAGRVEVLLTGQGSDKGGRYAAARVKPYQGQRHGHKPKNWAYVRSILEQGRCRVVDSTKSAEDAEADDLFGILTDHEQDVIMTQDKDMRMLPGIHMDWDSYVMFHTTGEFDVLWNDKQYGQKWFWLQMLHGDSADNIPGLPKYLGKNAKGVKTLKACGEVTAGKLLAGIENSQQAHEVVTELYMDAIGEGWDTQFAEQAVLLWMRRGSVAWDDVFRCGPLYRWINGQAYRNIQQRIEEARSYGQDQGQ